MRCKNCGAILEDNTFFVEDEEKDGVLIEKCGECEEVVGQIAGDEKCAV